MGNKNELNKEQEAAAYCTANAVIAAGAGSGKTTVLASRYVWLVTERKYRVREILTLTFTKKAATQMYRKIYLKLTEKAKEGAGAEQSSPAALAAQRALEEFSQARIQTLDSYSSSIVKQAANRYGISPSFSIDTERCLKIAMDEALPFVIANRNHPAMERLYFNNKPMAITGKIFASALYRYTHIDSPPNAKNDFGRQAEIVIGEWKKQSAIIIGKIEELAEVYRGNENYHVDIAPLLDQFSPEIFPGENELRGYFRQLLNMEHHAVTEWSEKHPIAERINKSFRYFLSFYELNMRKGSPRNNPAKEIAGELKKMFQEFSSLAVFCRQAGLIYSVLTLLSMLQNRYLERKRAEGILTYSDVSRLARIILLNETDIRRSEKESFKAIMIDEFQDNNEHQKDLLFLLAENENTQNSTVPSPDEITQGKLFFVGDEKQSIYRFRGADVSVFRKLSNDIASGNSGGKGIPLTINYRSAPRLIGAFNAIFGGYQYDPRGKSPQKENPALKKKHAVFAPENEIPQYEASYTPLSAYQESGGKLAICILDKQDSENYDEEAEILSPAETEARYVAEKIKILLNKKNEDGSRKYKPDDIAILFRTRIAQHLFEKHLMLLNIPYANENLNGFFYGGPVDDIMSVLRLAAYPEDRAAYAQMLRSPFAGLSLPSLAICMAALDDSQDGKIQAKPFDDAPLELLIGAEKEKYRNGQRLYQKIMDMACKKSISSLISILWYEEGYRYETEWNPVTASFRELYDYLFHLAAIADEENCGLAAFTDHIQSLEKPGERLDDLDIPIERPGAVSLLTVHRSKGLEYKVVFLCCCHARDRSSSSDDIFDTGPEGLTLNPPLPPEFSGIKDVRRNYFWERSRVIEDSKKLAELRRLLYVGMTRAGEELYLSGCLDISRHSCAESENGTPENFAKKLKQFIDYRIAEEKNSGIKGDTIIKDNTFFGLCLPSLGEYIPDDDSADAQPFFDIEQIPCYDESHVRSAGEHGSRFSNDQEGLNAFFSAAEPFYRAAQVITTPDVPVKHCTPTSLHTALPEAAHGGAGGFSASRTYSGKDSPDVFGKIDALLNRYAKQQGEGGEIFSFGSFGTIAHICLESKLGSREVIIPAALSALLAPKDLELIIEAGKELAQRFAQSPLGIIAAESKNRKNEYRFRSLAAAAENEFFISGTIDLVFDDSDTVYVVDFKTDREELPGIHIPQMACYYRAVSDLFVPPKAGPKGKKCQLWLYHLRSGHAVEVTEKAADFSLNAR